MSLHRLRSRCQDLVRELDIPAPFSAEALCDQIAEQRGRRLYLHPLPPIGGEGAPCGMWVATDAADHVYFEAATSPLHQEHIILHEIAHMLCGHTMPGLGDTFEGLDDAIGLDRAAVQSALARTRYTSNDEQEAEMVATVILEERARQSAPPSPREVGLLEEMFGISDGSRRA